MHRFLKQVGYFLLIIILLPYIITVFINGNGITKGVSVSGKAPYLLVMKDEKENKLSLEEYGAGILAKEMDADYDIEALKAQAILIRTSIYKTIQDAGSETVHTKEYWTRNQMKTNWGVSEYAEKYEKIVQAWQETEGQVLLYEGQLALTPYHKLSNGKTRSGNEVFGTEEYPYLKVKKCKEDIESEDAMTAVLINEKNVVIKNKDSAGYVTKVKCAEGTLSGEEFRNKYHLTSACFVVQDFEEQTRVTVTGIGHGIGMSQNYANIMAAEGKTYKEILEYFFEGTVLEEVAEVVIQ